MANQSKPSKDADPPISNEEDMVNRYLAEALREEIAKLRERSEARGLPNSQSDSALASPRTVSFLPDYLTGFRIPTLGSSSTTSSLQSAIRNMNFNQHEGSSTTTQEDPGANKEPEQDMETQETSTAAPPTAPNPFQDNLEEPSSQVNVSNTSVIQEDFVSDVEASQFFGTQLSPSHVDSIKENLISPSQNVSRINSDTFLVQNTPSRLRRSGRLISKAANLGIKVTSSKGKPGKKSSTQMPKTSKNANKKSSTSVASRLFTLGSQGLSQALAFPNPFAPNPGKQAKRLLESSPPGALPRKQSKTDSRIEKQLDFNGVNAPREKRPERRSRTRGAERESKQTHVASDVCKQTGALTTPTAQPKQTHVAPSSSSTPHGSLNRVLLGTLGGSFSQDREKDILPWPSAHNLDEFTSDLSPVPQAKKHSNLHISEILNDDLDPDLAKKIMNLPRRRSSTLESSSKSTSEESVALCDIYPPKTVQGRGITSAPSLENVTKLNSRSSNPKGNTLDPISKLRELCDNTKFTNSSTNLPDLQIRITNNQEITNNFVSFPGDTIPKLTNWDGYLKSLNTNPFSSNSQSVASSNSTSVSRTVLKKSTFVSSVKNIKNTNITNNIVSQQENPREPIFEDAKSIWAQLRNALCRDVILRLRQKNLETMLNENLIPKWSVTYMPPSGLLTNQSQVLHVIDVRRQLFRQQAECTIYLTQREIDTIQKKIEDLKRSLSALYKTPAAKDFSFEAALNSAIVQADKQRRTTFEELNKRLNAIRQNPEGALWINIPDELREQMTNPQPDPEPQPSTSAEPQPGPSRARPQQRSETPRPQSRSTSNQRNQPQGGQGGNQWIKVVKKSRKNKGQGKSSTNAPYSRNNQQSQPRQQPREPKDELYDLLSNFFRRNNRPNNTNNKNNNKKSKK